MNAAARYYLHCLSHGKSYDESFADPPVPRPCPSGSRDAACEVEVLKAELSVVSGAVVAREGPASLEELNNLERWAVASASMAQASTPSMPWGNVQMLMRAARTARELRVALHAIQQIRFSIAGEARGLGVGEETVRALCAVVERIHEREIGDAGPVPTVTRET